jgi:DNA-binding NarL/FixJ family response regulator
MPVVTRARWLEDDGMVTAPEREGPIVVGRETELAAAAAFVDARPAHACALLLEGEAGIGKTTLVRALKDCAGRAGLRVVGARPSAGETEVPHAGLGDLLADAGDALDGLAGPQREAIEVALARKSGPLDEHALARGLMELLRSWGETGDLLVVVDDVQWLDRPTAAALAFALRRLDSAPLRVVASVRSGAERAGEHPLGVGDWRDVHRLVVGPMSVTELGALVRDRLEVQFSRPRLAELRRLSGGNPMLALELAEQGPTGGMEASTLVDAVAAKLRAAGPDAWTAVSCAAAALRPTPGLLRSAGVGREDMAAAAAAGLLRVSGDGVSFTHPLVGSVAYDLLGPEERREMHARLGAAGADPLERGHHVSRAASGPDAAAARIVEEAADEAARRGDPAGAAALFLRSAELSPDETQEDADRRQVRAAAELEHAGDVVAAARLCRSLIERLPPGNRRATARQRLVSAAVGLDFSYEDGLAELAAALEDAAGDPALRAGLHADMSEIACGMCRLDDAVAHARIAYELAEETGATEIAVAALTIQGFAESMLGRGIPEASRAAYARWDGDLRTSTSPRMDLACVCLAATAFDEAEALLQDELVMAQEHGLESVEVVARAHLAEVQVRAGRWADALANARLALEHALQASEPQIVAGVSSGLAMAEALLGWHEAAAERAQEALATAEAIQDFWGRTSHRAVLGLVALADDDPGRAVTALEPAWELMRAHGLGDLSLFPVGHILGEALVALGRLDDAEAVASALAACPVGAAPWCRAMSSRLAALVASARGDHAAARAALASALSAHDDLPEPFERARTLHLAGRIQRQGRSWGAARTALTEALERFDELGAARWAEKAAADLARLPGRRPADRHGLTPRERDVAELVATGLSNREVAARLYVSVRTVEANLSRIYAKLGVRRRGALARRLDTPPDA